MIGRGAKPLLFFRKEVNMNNVKNNLMPVEKSYREYRNSICTGECTISMSKEKYYDFYYTWILLGKILRGEFL